jgi:hypothetical protein
MRSSLMSEANDRDFAPPPAPSGEQSDSGEYVFRFRVETPTTDEAAYDDPLVELVRGQLADLLDAVVLTHRGRRVAIDGFCLLQEPEKEYRIFPPADGEDQPQESRG